MQQVMSGPRSLRPAAALRITDLPQGVASQIPARHVAEMRHDRVDARLHNRGSHRVLYLIPLVHCGVYPVHLHLFHRRKVVGICRPASFGKGEALWPLDPATALSVLICGDTSEAREGQPDGESGVGARPKPKSVLSNFHRRQVPYLVVTRRPMIIFTSK
jgi:hypothetical protein